MRVGPAARNGPSAQAVLLRGLNISLKLNIDVMGEASIHPNKSINFLNYLIWYTKGPRLLVSIKLFRDL